MGKLVLPVSTLEDVTRHRAEFERASIHGYETRDAMIRHAPINFKSVLTFSEYAADFFVRDRGVLSWSFYRLIWAQVHSAEKRHQRDGVKAADQMMKLGIDESRQLMYLAAVGEYNLGKVVEARQRLKQLLQEQPDFGQASALLAAVDDKLTTDTLVAGGALATVAAVAGVVVGLLAAGKR